MSGIDHLSRVEAHNADLTKAGTIDNKSKQCTGRELIMELKGFADDFKQYDDCSKISIPQAEMGIGPVKYNMTFKPQQEISNQKLQKLNEIIKLEKQNGDSLVKFDAALLFLATGQEDPWHTLPSLLRIAARAEIEELTRKCIQESQCAHIRHAIPLPMLPLIQYFDDRAALANGCEGALIFDLCRQYFEYRGRSNATQMKSCGIKHILSKRRKDKMCVRVSQGLMRSMFDSNLSDITDDEDDEDNEDDDENDTQLL